MEARSVKRVWDCLAATARQLELLLTELTGERLEDNPRQGTRYSRTHAYIK